MILIFILERYFSMVMQVLLNQMKLNYSLEQFKIIAKYKFLKILKIRLKYP